MPGGVRADSQQIPHLLAPPVSDAHVQGPGEGDAMKTSYVESMEFAGQGLTLVHLSAQPNALWDTMGPWVELATTNGSA